MLVITSKFDQQKEELHKCVKQALTWKYSFTIKGRDET